MGFGSFLSHSRAIKPNFEGGGRRAARLRRRMDGRERRLEETVERGKKKERIAPEELRDFMLRKWGKIAVLFKRIVIKPITLNIVNKSSQIQLL